MEFSWKDFINSYKENYNRNFIALRQNKMEWEFNGDKENLQQLHKIFIAKRTFLIHTAKLYGLKLEKDVWDSSSIEEYNTAFVLYNDGL